MSFNAALSWTSWQADLDEKDCAGTGTGRRHRHNSEPSMPLAAASGRMGF